MLKKNLAIGDFKKMRPEISSPVYHKEEKEKRNPNSLEKPCKKKNDKPPLLFC
jgi:hypothetical protein